MDCLLELGADPVTGSYVIPAECTVSHSRVKEQLEILKTIATSLGNPSKIQKTDFTEASSLQDTIASTSTDHSIKAIKCEQGLNDSIPRERPETSKMKSQASSSSLADFFKERRQAFQAKNPESMRAPSPPKQKQIPQTRPQIPPNLKQFFPLVLPVGRMAEKLRLAAPYNMFLTAVTASPPTHFDPGFITFLDLLDPSLGELESSVQSNFTVDISWLFAQYTVAGLNDLPLIILYGAQDPQMEQVNQMLPNVTSFMIKVPGSFGCHHAKVMLLFYKDKSMRVVVSTANLYQDDWDNRVQGIWVSERLPALPKGSTGENHGESVTNFRKDLVRFLTNYRNPSLQPYIDRIKMSDFSSIKVFLITSIPGAHQGDDHGHLRLGTLLKENSAQIDDKNPIIMQSSSLGNFGPSAASYLTGEIVKSMSAYSPRVGGNQASIKLIYPSLSNVKRSHDGIMGGGCLPYMRDAHNRQPWLNQHLYQWKCESRNCNRAMPHIKSYCRYTHEDGVFWFVLTSANMSKSAWGVMKKKTLNINSYEVGVAFFPRVILDGKDVFPMNKAQQKDNTPIFKMPYDLPPVPYERGDAPFCIQDMMEIQGMM